MAWTSKPRDPECVRGRHDWHTGRVRNTSSSREMAQGQRMQSRHCDRDGCLDEQENFEKDGRWTGWH